MNDTVKNCYIVTDVFLFQSRFQETYKSNASSDMDRAPLVAIPHKVDRSNPNLSNALKTLENFRKVLENFRKL